LDIFESDLTKRDNQNVCPEHLANIRDQPAVQTPGSHDCAQKLHLKNRQDSAETFEKRMAECH
jgi:hypothetical protein